MKNTSLLALVCLIVLILLHPSHAVDKKRLRQELERHPARAIDTWAEYIDKEIQDRILPAPDIIIDYLRKDNQYQGYSEQPRKPIIDLAFRQDIVQAIDELPQSIKTGFKKNVIAVFLVKELGGSAYAEMMRDFDKNKMGFIVLDIDSLNRKANDWATWRENSPFVTKGGYTIEAEIEEPNNNDRKAGIQYIFLHELGHLIGVVKEAHPHWARGGKPKNWPFARLSWRKAGGFKGTSKYDRKFKNRRKIKFYGFARAGLTSREIDVTYNQFLKTNFVSLYAATNMYDDFAETYAQYVHVVLQNKPWIIRIKQADKTIRVINRPILDERCAAKKKYMHNLFR